ncbi:MAG: hypothetical protein IPM42_07770 [Saprospiraceae bacterium]|nr:hypothetical protein [Saprospiraceae bacterium]
MIGNKPSKKKIAFPVSELLQKYLERYNRITKLPILYDDLLGYIASTPLMNNKGLDTHWETVYYSEYDQEIINNGLCLIYALLKTDGNIQVIDHLTISRIDFCVFGNTHPFRIRIINKLNDNYDHFYIKRTDASRIYGLELEELLSPNSFSYLIHGNTIIEEHIAGIPGDDFILNHLEEDHFNQIRIAKEFIKFNERCFIQLLGDMRSYNYIVSVTPDIEGSQFRIRSIDFDQQSYEGRKQFYLPQYFKENNGILQLGFRHLTQDSVTQYQLEERSLIARRARISGERLTVLLNSMSHDTISHPDKVMQLKSDLAVHHQNDDFLKCKNMGEIVTLNIQLVLQKEFSFSMLENKS